jgi:hypothetical protein
MEYAHEEVIRELGITVNDLPSEIKNKIRTWNNKKRLASKPETIELLTGVSEDIADDITAWHYATSGEEEDEDEEEEEEYEAPKPQNIVSHVTNPEVVDQHKEEEKKSGWGLKNLSNW